MNDFNVVIPSLERRDDRWYTCLGNLLTRHIPADRISRFIARDGKQYRSVNDAREHAIHMFPDCKYLDGEQSSPYTYCWCWTWYEILCQIAKEDNESTLILLDDWGLRINHSQISNHVRCVYNTNYEFKIIQYVNTAPNCKVNPAKPNLPEFTDDLTHEIAGSGDILTLMSPLGAKAFLQNMENHPMCSPEGLFWFFAYEADQSGCYSTSPNLAPARGLSNIHVNPWQDRAQRPL